MDKFRFLEVIKNPQGMSSGDFESLEEVLRHYPFCQSAYLLKAKYLFDRGNMHAEKTLRKAAVYATDRVILKQLVLGGHEPPVAVTPPFTPVEPTPVISTPDNEPQNEVVIEEKAVIVTTESNITDSTPEPKDTDVTSEPESQAEKKTPITNNNTVPELEKEYDLGVERFILDEIAAIPDDEPLIVKGRVVIEEWKKELASDGDAIEQSLDIAESSLIKESPLRRNASGLGTLLEFIDFVDGPEEYGFSHLYKFEELSLQPVFLQNSRLGEEVNELEGNTATSEAEFLLDYLQYLSKKPAKKPKTNLDFDYIDRFIKEEPRISRIEPRLFDYNKGKDMASESVVEDTDLVSENLAQIMVNQNKIKRAIEIYQKLILKYPDKKGYFAQKIEDLDKN